MPKIQNTLPLRRSYLTEKYTMFGAPGFGISASSVRGVLQAAGKLCREGRWPLNLDDVEAMALGDEQRSARSRAMAADDVIPVVRGRAVEVYTFADGSFTHKLLIAARN